MVTVATRKRSHLGVGLYSLAEAARILRAPTSNIWRWTRPDGGLVPRFFDAAEDTLTFVELMELHFIAMFRAEGVSLQTVRQASAAAAQKFGSDYPFSVRRFDTDGKTVFATLIHEQADTVAVEDLKRGQYVFDQIVRPFFRKLDYRGSMEVARYWPLEKGGRIVLDPERKFGKPIDSETGVPTKAIFEAVNAGEGQDAATVADWLGIPLAAVNAAVKFEQSIAS